MCHVCKLDEEKEPFTLRLSMYVRTTEHVAVFIVSPLDATFLRSFCVFYLFLLQDVYLYIFTSLTVLIGSTF
jgi:hypothetical protein